MEIERKFLIEELPANLYDYKCSLINQGYISTTPVIRIRQINDVYYLTMKSKGLISREEYEMGISESEFLSLLPKIENNIISKNRYFIPFHPYTIELDVFKGLLEGLSIAEVEFISIDEANAFTPPLWFGKEVSSDSRYHNSNLCKLNNIKSLD